MTMPRDHEKELSNALVTFRAKRSELNLVNSEFIAAEKKRDRLYSEYEKYCNQEMQPVGAKLTEIRSELQALQAQMLDLLIEMTLRGQNE